MPRRLYTSCKHWQPFLITTCQRTCSCHSYLQTKKPHWDQSTPFSSTVGSTTGSVRSIDCCVSLGLKAHLDRRNRKMPEPTTEKKTHIDMITILPKRYLALTMEPL